MDSLCQERRNAHGKILFRKWYKDKVYLVCNGSVEIDAFQTTCHSDVTRLQILTTGCLVVSLLDSLLLDCYIKIKGLLKSKVTGTLSSITLKTIYLYV